MIASKESRPQVTPAQAGHLRTITALLVDHAGDAAAVPAAGYGLAFAGWSASHPQALAGFVLANQLDTGSRAELARWLLVGAAGAAALWLLLGFTAYRTQRASGFWPWTAALTLVALLASAVPVLALPGLETQHSFLTLGIIAALAALTFLRANRALQLWQPATGSGAQSASVSQKVTVPASLSRSIPVRAPTWSTGLSITVLLALAYAVFMSLLTVSRHNAFLTNSFDLGIHDQAMYTLLRDGYMRSTQYGAQAINYIGDHFSPIFYLVAPLYALYQDARWLLILQSLALGLGAIPVYLLGRHKTGSQYLALALAASYLLYPALHGVNTFDFHQLALVPPLLALSLFFLETDRDWPFLLTLGLALMVKEEMGLTVAAIGLYVFLYKRRYGLGALLMSFGLVYFVTVVKVIMPALGGVPQINRFEGFMAPGSTGLTGLAQTLLTNPIYSAQYMFGNPAKLLYLGQMLLPVLFLPLLAGPAWLMALPALAVALLSSFEPQYSITAHYTASITPFIYVMAATVASKVGTAKRRPLALAAAILVASLAMNYEFGWIGGKKLEAWPAPTKHVQAVSTLFGQIPGSASVSALGSLVPHVSTRENIFLFPIVNDAEYILFDSDTSANFWPNIGLGGRGDAVQAMLPYLTSGTYGVVDIQDGSLLLGRGHDTARNQEGLQVLLGARYEAEKLSHDIEVFDVADPEAGNGITRLARPDPPRAQGKSALTWGPFDTLLPGKYRVAYRLKTDGRGQPGRLATLDIFSTSAGGPLAGMDVATADFQAPDQYQDFVVDLETGELRKDIEYRVFYSGRGNLWVDAIQITPVRVTLPSGLTLEFSPS